MKTSEAVQLQYNGIVVHFTGDAWFNATEAANAYGKLPNDWLRLDETKAYIKALGDSFNCGFKPQLNNRNSGALIQTSRGRIGGTWIHPKLVVAFARWLDPKFAVWCDMQIDAMLRGTHAYANPPRHSLLIDKRSTHEKMMDALIEFREEQGKDTHSVHFISENKLCNFVITGKFETLDETTLNNENLKLLGEVRRRNESYLMAGLDYADRKQRLIQFVIKTRTKAIA